MLLSIETLTLVWPDLSLYVGFTGRAVAAHTSTTTPSNSSKECKLRPKTWLKMDGSTTADINPLATGRCLAILVGCVSPLAASDFLPATSTAKVLSHSVNAFHSFLPSCADLQVGRHTDGLRSKELVV